MSDSRPAPNPHNPVRYDPVTTTAGACPACGARFQPRGRQRFCSNACRQRAYRLRTDDPAPAPTPTPHPPARATVYECPQCATRQLNDQRCPDCNTFCRRIGAGGLCPHCDEPIAHADLT